MTTLTLENERFRLGIVPDLGAGVRTFEVRARGEWCDVWRRGPESPAHFNELGNYILAPWCNRIDGAQFEFDEKVRVLRPNWPDGTAIHGDVHHRAWRLTDRSPVSARCEVLVDTRDRNWPWPFAAAARYELGERELMIGLTLTNLGGSPMPAGMGLHPFWMKSLGGADERALVTMPVSGRYPCERVMAVGPSVVEGLCERLAQGTEIDEELDDVFSGFTGAEIDWKASGVKVRMTAHRELAHSVIFNEKDKDWFCLEPVSMVNNAFALRKLVPGTGVRVVKPGETIEWWVRFAFDFAE